MIIDSRHFLHCRTLLAASVLLAMHTAMAAPAPAPRSVHVVGHGEVRTAPDRARLSMAVQATNPDLDAAEKKVDRIVRTYVAKARALGAKEADLSTAGYTVQPQYDYSGKDGRRFLGYQVTRRIELTVRDLGKVGDYLQQATAAGVNEVSAPVLESSKAADLRLKALAEAADNARDQARVLARTLDMKLGPVHTLDASAESPSPPRPVMMRAMAMSASPKTESGNEAMGFSAGEIVFDAHVSADFDLLPP